MSSYLSGLLTNTTSRYASLRSLITTSETDGDTPDDTHLCRVLRGYYVEKGRSFPAWLPPDPKAPPPAQATYAQPNPQIGAGYGGANMTGGSKLGSLWGDNAGAQQAQQPPNSLRAGGRGAPTQNLRPGGGAQRDPYARSQITNPEPQVSARPLPSQRLGSYQAGATPPGSSGASGNAAGGNTAQDRLKARLWGAARASSPGLKDQQAPVQQAAAAFSRTNSYGSQTSNGTSSNYEDSFMPGARTGSGGGSGRGGGGGSSSGDRPFMAATSPWASSEPEFNGAGYGGNQPRQAPAKQGLPTGGPRRGGLPGGPRPPR